MKTNQTICRYVVVRFLPYIDREEFVNVGVVTAFPELGKIDFKLELSHTKRVTDFFPEFSRHQFEDLAKRFYQTFNEIRDNCIATPLFGTDATSFNSFFDHLVKPYDELFQFSKCRICLTDRPLQETEKMFARFVKQGSTESLPGHEEEMITRTPDQLKSHWLIDNFYKK